MGTLSTNREYANFCELDDEKVKAGVGTGFWQCLETWPGKSRRILFHLLTPFLKSLLPSVQENGGYEEKCDLNQRSH